jgi:hypothetical protein
MARILGQTNLLPWMENEANDLRACLLQSIELTQAAFQTNYIPGCADLGDFDASATAIALWPAAEWRHLPQDELRFTFDKYYAEVLTPRLRGTADPTSGYVPYEMRLGTAFLIMGEKRKAWDLARHFLGVTRRTAGTNGPRSFTETAHPRLHRRHAPLLGRRGLYQYGSDDVCLGGRGPAGAGLGLG